MSILQLGPSRKDAPGQGDAQPKVNKVNYQANNNNIIGGTRGGGGQRIQFLGNLKILPFSAICLMFGLQYLSGPGNNVFLDRFYSLKAKSF